MKKILLFLLLFIFVGQSFSQPTPVNFQLVSEFEYSWYYSCYQALFDKLDRPYIYSANNELGFIVYDISDINNPLPIDTMRPVIFGGLTASNIIQSGNYLYLSLGGFQGVGQSAGLAILNISDPEAILIEDQWDSTAFNQGNAITVIEGDYAYLGVMDLGIVILDISDKSNIRFVSSYKPDPNWPHFPGLFSVPNARGMAVRNDTMYLCYDAGALRVIDVTDKENPFEIGHYINPSLDATARSAYNNVALAENYAYVAVDYCGIDVVDISDPTNPVNVGWVNPWNCSPTNWNGRPGHTNQILTFRNNSLLFVSGGDTEILVYDISDRENPVELGSFFNLSDSIATWGIDVKENYAVLAQVDNPFGQPYIANWGGIRILHWDGGVSGVDEKLPFSNEKLTVFPNPATESITIKSKEVVDCPQPVVELFDVAGRQVLRVEFGHDNNLKLKDELSIPFPELDEGIYTIFLETKSTIQMGKVVIKR